MDNGNRFIQHVYRKDDGERFSRHADGYFRMDKYPDNRWSYEALMATGAFALTHPEKIPDYPDPGRFHHGEADD